MKSVNFVVKLRYDPYTLGRIIARPFVGEPGAFVRTPNRHDYALKPFKPTVMDALKDGGKDVIAIGKISDILTVKVLQNLSVQNPIWTGWTNLSLC